jgi:hypothetical protein
MPDSSQIDDTAELLRLAQRACDRARVELQGDALGVADRLSQQILFLRNVAEVLAHEARRQGKRATPQPAAAIEGRPER